MHPCRALLPFLCALCAFAVNSPAGTATAGRLAEIAEKETRLRAFLAAESLDGVLFATQRNFAWFSAGGDSHVVINADEGSAALLWLAGKRYVLAPENEIARIQNEELAGLGFEPVTWPWHDSAGRAAAVKRLAAGRKIAADIAGAGAEKPGEKLEALRYSLTGAELARCRELGRVTAAIVEQTARDIVPGETEEQIQGRLLGRLYKENIVSTVVLVAADGRIPAYKHAITKNTPVHRHAIISVCAKKHGLIVAVTRAIHFGPLPPEMQQRQEKLNTIYAEMLRATTAGAGAAAVFEKTLAAYAAAGFPDGWTAHHQGGPIGYRERDYKIFPGCPQTLCDRQAFAWNPTLPGVKIEETFVIRDGIYEFLTQTGDWPSQAMTINNTAIQIPQILIK
jgi:antitoxin VapB